MTNIASAAPTGVEIDAPKAKPAAKKGEATLLAARTRLIQGVLRDQTDGNAELAAHHEWLWHPSQIVRLQGNVFAIEDTIDGNGTVWIKNAPLPPARAVRSEWDLEVNRDGVLKLQQDDKYLWQSAKYSGGKWGRIEALHGLQRAIRPYDANQDGLLLTNTWGDRARDAHLKPEFMRAEIEAAARLGADIVQIDDGWQHGTTANSSKRSGGAWDGFWASDPNFWDQNRERFPDGLKPLVDLANTQKLRMGLWFAPDSSHNAANWRRDADALMKLHRELGIDFFKVDALKIESVNSENNFRQLFNAVRDESKGKVSFDFDITAERRFGYFDLMAPGRLFVENRYTDWGRYWPHHTLRVAWQLSHWVDPVRLRLEWLNNARNNDKYPNDPLAPSHYAPDALFATTMMCSPLGWFENQKLPESYFKQAAPLIATWKTHRQAMHSGTILPVGDAPDGMAWTGFVSLNTEKTAAYVLMFRELNASQSYELRVPQLQKSGGKIEVLGGSGSAVWKNEALQIQIPNTLRFVWLRVAG